MPGRVPKNLRNPDESVRLPGVEEDLVYVGEEVVARVVQYPGWRWSNDMRAIAGGQWCESHHVGVTGEVEVVGEQIRGLAVHEAARIAAAANPGEILVSQTTRDLAAGAGLLFEDCGLHPLMGIPEPRRLFALSEGPVDGLDDEDHVAPRPGSQA